MSTVGHRAYDRLPELPTGERHAWDFFGDTDELGCLNFIGEAEVIAAAREVTRGLVVNLNLPVGEPQPQFWAKRPALQHEMIKKRNIRDDVVNHFAMQGSTQWDGFRHQRYRQFGFYGGRQDDDLDIKGQLGIERWAERGIVTRGVLVDVAGYCERRGTPVNPQQRFGITGDLMAAVLADQETSLSRGDILLIRTGWLGWYRALEGKTRDALATRLAENAKEIALPGIDPRVDTIRWVWNQQVAALAFDNPTAETVPYVPEDGWAHHRLLALLGIPLGELWHLDDLAEACAREHRYSFMLTSAPLFLRGGAGSPANAYAVM